uniref:Uncharacterized protein n=1 Tax=Panstrongylus lignarius TaxID=156445 RepID=A0A224Y393_9HEMI
MKRSTSVLGCVSPSGAFILDTASSACIIRVLLVGCPSQTSCVEPRYLARNSTPSMSTAGSWIITSLFRPFFFELSFSFLLILRLELSTSVCEFSGDFD